MVNYWDGHPEGSEKLLRLLTRDGKWLRWEGEKEDPNDPSEKPKAGCKDQVEEALLAALHSTNVVVLLGSGASFSAKNDGEPDLPAPLPIMMSKPEKGQQPESHGPNYQRHWGQAGVVIEDQADEAGE